MVTRFLIYSIKFQLNLCVPGRSSNLSSVHSSEKVSAPSITFSLLASPVQDSSTVKLAIAVECASDLPSRDYGAHCDPWVSVTVFRKSKSLRRRPLEAISFFRTKSIRHSHNPQYVQTFVTDVQQTDMKVLWCCGDRSCWYYCQGEYQGDRGR